ncbi:MAG: Rnf-Nqr domain containing protein, partial [Eubacteriales bacterium]
PKQVRIAVFIVIISGFVTAVELLMKAYFYDLYGALGIFLPLIVVNCIILARAEAFASKNPVLPSAIDGLSCGIGFTLALFVIASIRELLGNGTFLGFEVFGENYPAAVVFVLPAGAFLTLGCVIAAVQALKNKADAKRSEKEAVAEAATNAAPAATKEVQA